MSIIYKKQIAANINVAVWQISESEEDLLKLLQLSDEDRLNICSIKLQSVRLQKLACRAALAELLGTKTISISYSNNGQPLIEGHHISFSHTKSCVAVALSNRKVGIDLETVSTRILTLYERFMSREEITQININNLEVLYYYWCAKEAMFKWYAIGDLDFIDDLKVNRATNTGQIKNQFQVALHNIEIGEFVCIVCY